MDGSDRTAGGALADRTRRGGLRRALGRGAAEPAAADRAGAVFRAFADGLERRLAGMGAADRRLAGMEGLERRGAGTGGVERLGAEAEGPPWRDAAGDGGGGAEGGGAAVRPAGPGTGRW